MVGPIEEALGHRAIAEYRTETDVARQRGDAEYEAVTVGFVAKTNFRCARCARGARKRVGTIRTEGCRLIAHRVRHAGFDVCVWQVGGGTRGLAIAYGSESVEKGVDRILDSGLGTWGGRYDHIWVRIKARIFRELSRVIACVERNQIAGDDPLYAIDGVEIGLEEAVESVESRLVIGRDVIEAVDLSIGEAQVLGRGKALILRRKR